MKDQFGRDITYLRVSVTELCNLRCLYCMPEEGIKKRAHSEMMTEEELILAIRTAAELGIKKVRITGGEPLEKRNILSICEKITTIPGIEELCVTTNATLLPRYAADLKRIGVEHINISLDTLNPEKYRKITRVGSLEQALAGLKCALDTGFHTIKVNAVLIGGFNDDEIRPLAELTLKHPMDVRFIELMPMVGPTAFPPEAFIPVTTVLSALPEAVSETPDGGVARLIRLPGALGNVGLISPVSDHFCGECNRLRLTADGKLKPCLHSADEFSVKDLDAAGMRQTFIHAVNAKPAMHPPLSATEQTMSVREMYRIGG